MLATTIDHLRQSLTRSLHHHLLFLLLSYFKKIERGKQKHMGGKNSKLEGQKQAHLRCAE